MAKWIIALACVAALVLVGYIFGERYSVVSLIIAAAGIAMWMAIKHPYSD
jgi:hypothetical protein